MLFNILNSKFFGLILFLSLAHITISCGSSNRNISDESTLSDMATVSVATDKTTIRAMNRVRYLYPGYYSSTMGDFVVNYYNPTLPWGTTVLLKYGFKTNYHRNYHPGVEDWTDQESFQANAISPYTWEAKFERQVASRGGPHKSHLQFVVQIILPDDSIIYDRGSSTPLGYYEMEIVPCAPSDGDAYCERPLQRIEK